MVFIRNIKKWKNQFGLELLACWRNNEQDELGIQTDHAAANETSLVMALKPELVKIKNLPEDKNQKPLGLEGKDPREFASAELGRKIIDRQVERMSKILNKKLMKITSRD